MILADTSVWIDHLRGRGSTLARLLTAGRVLTHPFVIGELALGNLMQRETILKALRDLPPVTAATHDEVMRLVEHATLFGSGIGYVDAHLLASTRLARDATLWTLDRRLSEVATRLSVAASLPP